MNNLLKNKKYISSIFWILFLFIFFDGFGLRKLQWDYNYFGLYKILQQIFLFFSFLFFIFNFRLYFNSSNSLSLAIKMYFFLIIIILIQSLFQYIINDKVSFWDLFDNFFKLKYVLLYFIITTFIFYFDDSDGLVNAFIFGGFLSIFAIVLVFFFHYKSDAINLSFSIQNDRQMRIIIPTSLILVFNFFYFLNLFFKYLNFYFLLLSILFFIFVIIQLHRSVLFSITICLIIYIYENIKSIKSSYKLSLSFILFSILFFINSSLDGILFNTINSGYNDLINNTGSASGRNNLVLNSLNYVLNNYFLIGVGLNWERLTNFLLYLKYSFIAGPTFDSGYANIIITYGIIGLVFYFYLIFNLLKILNNIKLSNNNFVLAKTLKYLLIFIIFNSIGSDNFLIYNSALLFSFLISITYFINAKN